MAILIGVFLILWGLLVICFSIFKLKRGDGRDKHTVNGSFLIEVELLLKLLDCFPVNVVRGLIIFIGISFIISGAATILLALSFI